MTDRQQAAWSERWFPACSCCPRPVGEVARTPEAERAAVQAERIAELDALLGPGRRGPVDYVVTGAGGPGDYEKRQPAGIGVRVARPY